MDKSVQITIYITYLVLLSGCDWFGANPLFIEMNSERTGIDFSNTLTYNDSLTVLEYEFMYDGGGVGLIDVNNDGLLDLYFTGNMVTSRLYLNKGNWHFEDITEAAGVGTTGWVNGVSIVDINQDGFQDIYLSLGGPRGRPVQDRANLLFINDGLSNQTKRGIPTFTETAADYGLADTEYSVQAAFFDYDRDGDLDVYMLSNALVNFNRNISRPIDATGKAPSVDRLYRNNGNQTFSDVSQEAGILIEGFGLGVVICDINQDLWPDIYVANDFLTDDLIYINQHDGSFVNQVGQYLKHLTYNGMGVDLADFNNDGLSDIVVVDMYPPDNRRRKLTMMGNNYDEFQNSLSYGYQPQYVRNTLQLNNGNGSFSEIGQLAGIDATDWSWSVLLADYDNDGWKDLFITNGIRQDITNLDFMVYGQQVLVMGTPEANKKQRLEALNKLPGIKLPNYMYKNQGDLTFADVSESWGLSAPTYSNGAVYGDLDNDGDLDLVINNIDQEASVYQNLSDQEKNPANYLRIKLVGPLLNREGIGAKVYLSYNGLVQSQYFTPVRGYISSVEPFLHFGLGIETKIEHLRVVWPDGHEQTMEGIEANQTITLEYGGSLKQEPKAEVTSLFTPSNGQYGIEYLHRENHFVDFKLQPLLPHMHSRNGPGITVGDVNGDGLEDFFIGGATGYTGRLFLQLVGGKFQPTSLGQDSLSEDMGVILFDVDNDNDLDLCIVSGGTVHIKESVLYTDRLYLNDGKGNFVRSAEALPDSRQSGSSIVASDYDRDGDLDLFIGGRVVPGEYPLPARSRLLRNDTPPKSSPRETESQQWQVKFTDVTDQLADGLSEVGLVTSALWTDYDNDDWMDLIVTGEFMPILFFHNEEGKLVNRTEATGLQNTLGWWNSLVGGDFDQDGDIDYLVGNLGLNTRFKASPDKPLSIYAKDYDNNGRIDPVLCYYVQGKKYIAHSRTDIFKQINAMRARFTTYTDYAEATFDESFLPQELEDAYVVRSEQFASSYLENLGHGKFSLKQLPIEAQLSPIFGMTTGDYDQDGNLDVLTVGNFYASEVSTGRYDASIGLFLRGDGKGNFEPVKVTESGFFADGDAKGLAQIRIEGGQTLVLVANNAGHMGSYEVNSPGMVIQAQNQETYALITLKDGRTYKQEFYYGSTYLSHTSRSIILTKEVESVVIYDYLGNSRNIKSGL